MQSLIVLPALDVLGHAVVVALATRVAVRVGVQVVLGVARDWRA